MNILFVTQWYPNRQQAYFGIFVREHARAVHKAGHNVNVLALSLHKSKGLFNSELNQITDEYGISTIQCELHSCLKNVLYHLPFVQEYFLLKTYNHYLVQFKPDIIHSQVIYPAGLWGSALARRLKVPHVLTEHWSRLVDFSKSIYFTRAIKVYQSADAILPVSAFLKTNIQSIVPGLRESQFSIVGNVVDNRLFYFQPEVKETGTLTFCAVATWQTKKKPDKMPELFIRALSILQQHHSRKINLVMIGGGDKTDELQEMCTSANVDARFTGFIPKEQIADELRKADYFVHASAIETFSIVVAEALACGLPVVCSNAGALPELINDENGIVCENTIENWTDALIRAISIQYNRHQIAHNAMSRFSMEAIGEKISAIYSRLHL